MDLGKKILEYSKSYAKALFDGELEAPSGADCWACYMETADGESLGDVTGNDHLLSHIEEDYFVPTLLSRAAFKHPEYVSPFLAEMIHNLWYKGGGLLVGLARLRPLMERQAKTLIRHYLRKQLGMKG